MRLSFDDASVDFESCCVRSFLFPTGLFDHARRTSRPGKKIVQALVVAMIVTIDEASDADFKIARQGVVLQQNAVLPCLMPAFKLVRGLPMIAGAANVPDVFPVLPPVRQISGDVAGTVIAAQVWYLNARRPVAARGASMYGTACGRPPRSNGSRQCAPRVSRKLGAIHHRRSE